MNEPYSPLDMQLANEVFDAMCGHGALAALLGISVMDAMRHFEKGGWVNIPMMKTAMSRAGVSFVRNPFIPAHGKGVALVQFLGRWMEPQVPKAARCAHRHWIAFSDLLVWDSNLERWEPLGEWEQWLPQIYDGRTTGHQVDAAWISASCEPKGAKQ